MAHGAATAAATAPVHDVVRAREAVIARLVVKGFLDARLLDGGTRLQVWKPGRATRFIYQPASDQWKCTLGMRRGKTIDAMLEKIDQCE